MRLGMIDEIEKRKERETTEMVTKVKEGKSDMQKKNREPGKCSLG